MPKELRGQEPSDSGIEQAVFMNIEEKSKIKDLIFKLIFSNIIQTLNFML